MTLGLIVNWLQKCVDLPSEHAAALSAAHLNDGASITACTRAAHALHAALSVTPAPSQRAVAVETSSLERMDVYVEQMTKLNALADLFADKLLAHLTTFFQNMVGVCTCMHTLVFSLNKRMKLASGIGCRCQSIRKSIVRCCRFLNLHYG
jgi:hypothetical protein